MKLRSIAAPALLLAAMLSAAHAASFTAGIEIAGDVDASKTGLRAYPGATAVTKKKGESESANIQFAFGDYGLKVVVAKLRSDDAPGKVAEFYRKELARFGEVLDCSSIAASTSVPRPKDRKSKAISCDDEKPRTTGLLYKAGYSDDQHVVDIKPVGSGSEFSLVHLNLRYPK